MVHRFLLWVVAGALTVWISLAMVVAPAVAFAAPDSGSDTDGAESSEPAAPAKPAKQHKPAKARAEKKADAGDSVGHRRRQGRCEGPAVRAQSRSDESRSAGRGRHGCTHRAGRQGSVDIRRDRRRGRPRTSTKTPKKRWPKMFRSPSTRIPTPRSARAPRARNPSPRRGGPFDRGRRHRANGSGTSSPLGVEAGTVEVKPARTQTRRDRARPPTAGHGRTDDRRGRLSRCHHVGPGQGRRPKSSRPQRLSPSRPRHLLPKPCSASRHCST